jgi:hypothetical protein
MSLVDWYRALLSMALISCWVASGMSSLTTAS